MLSAIALSHYPLLYKERSPFPRYSREAIAFLIHHYFTKSDRLSLSTATSDRPINLRLLCMSDRLYLSTLFWQAIAFLIPYYFIRAIALSIHVYSTRAITFLSIYFNERSPFPPSLLLCMSERFSFSTLFLRAIAFLIHHYSTGVIAFA